MNNQTKKFPSLFRPLFEVDELRPALLLVVGQVTVAFLLAVLITSSLPV